MTLNFNGPTPVSVILTASPRDAHERLNADLGIYAQDQWTIDRMTLNLGLRFDYLNAKLEAQNFPAGTFVPARSLGELTGLPIWKDLNPRLGLAYDLFGNGKTAVKTSLSRYVASQTVGFASQFNPLGGTVTGAGFSGTGADTRTWTDPNGDRIVQLSELGPSGNPLFGSTTLVTNPAEDVKEGWFKRAYNWEYSANIQHEFRPRMSGTFGYFRRWFGNYTHTDALLVGPSEYDPYCMNAPNDPRLPNAGQQICGLYDVKAAARGNLVDQPAGRFRGYLEAIQRVRRLRLHRQRAHEGQAAAGRRREHRPRPQHQLRNVRQPRCSLLRQHHAVDHPGEDARFVFASVRHPDQRDIPERQGARTLCELYGDNRDGCRKRRDVRPRVFGRQRHGRAGRAQHACTATV